MEFVLGKKKSWKRCTNWRKILVQAWANCYLFWFFSVVWQNYALHWYEVAKCPYKTTATCSLLHPDCETNFDSEGDLVFSGLLDSEPTVYSDKAWLVLSGYVTARITYWSTENPHAVHEVSLHDLKRGVWCIVSMWRIIGPVCACVCAFFTSPLPNKRVNSKCYVRLICHLLRSADEEKSCCHFV
jgi:hypothetical protein